MMLARVKICFTLKPQLAFFRNYSSMQSCKVLVIGGGSGGCTVAAKLARKLNKDDVYILEPASKHYYQPMFTLIGGGTKKLPQSYKMMKDVLPKNAKWIKESVAKFDPRINVVTTDTGAKIKYDYLVISLGIDMQYEKIPGLIDALNDRDGEVSTIYDPRYVEKTYKNFKKFKSGNAIFTYPNSPVKCAGAPQKIMYIFEDYLRKKGKANKANIIYNTNLPVLFGVKHYADTLWKVVKRKNIKVNLKTYLVGINSDKKVAVFQQHDNDKKIAMEYSFLHVTPPMGPPKCLTTCKELVDSHGYLNINKWTMQHVDFCNIFGLGDCTNSPNAKTGAAAAVQSGVVMNNLLAVMEGKPLKHKYDGYGSCPLVTGYSHCILAEFDYDLVPVETLPFSQNRELRLTYHMKKDILPHMYWNLMLKGYWNGPSFMRNLLHLRLNKLFS